MKIGPLLAFCLLLWTSVLRAAQPMDKTVQAIFDNKLDDLANYLKKGGDANARTGRDNTLLMYAAAFGELESVRVLLDNGADPNLKNAFGATALMWGVWDPARVKLLVAKGADVNAKAKSGTTPLLLAAMNAADEESVNILASHHADPSAIDGFGTNLLHAGTYAGNMTAVRLGLANHLDVNGKERSGITPLMNSAADGSVEIAKLLLKAGADPNAVSAPLGPPVKHGIIALGGFTSLILSTPYGPPAMTQLLLEHGAKVEPMDARGMTALHAAVASEAQNPEIVSLLLAKGADPAFKNTEGKSARNWALNFARPDVLKLLGAVPPEADQKSSVEQKPVTALEASRRGIALMETSTKTFFQQSGCVSCHSQNMTGMVVGTARQHGLGMNKDAAKERLTTVSTSWAPKAEGLLVRDDPPGGADMVAYALLGMAGEGYTPDFVTAAMARNLAVQQLAGGNWHRGGIARVPVEDSDITLTAISIRSLALFSNGGTRSEYNERISRAATWLASAKPSYSEEFNMRLLGLKWSGAPAATVDRAAREILLQQRASGGWGQNDFLPEDAYATGQALYALSEAGIAGNAAFRKGSDYLVRTQAPDGSWHVVSRSVKFQPYFQGGFPYDHDQWISSMGTGWATMALASAGKLP
jgi:ankyrin repeat protein